MQHLEIQIFDQPEDAPNYNHEGGYISAGLEKAFIILNGTVQGKPTVDLHFKSPHGEKYVALVTFELIKSLVAAGNGALQRES